MGVSSLDAFASGKLAALEKHQLRRRLYISDKASSARVSRNGRTLIDFSSNDYLGLSQHPAIKNAAAAATQRYGVGATGSRLITGNHPLFQALEARLAALKGTDDCVVFGSGFLANSGIIPTLIGKADVVFMDELSHACIFAGARLTLAAQHIFQHNDMGHLGELLRRHRHNHPQALIVTDGVFSMDGDLAPLGDLTDLAEAFDAWLMTDDAHGIGVVGDGRGSSFANGAHYAVPLQMGTLSKAIGGYGGYLCASTPVCDLVRNRCRTFVYSTGLPPGPVAAAIAALDLITETPTLAGRPLALARLFTRKLDLAVAESPIVPVILGDTTHTLDAAKMLEYEGFLVVPIRPPTVPDGTSRLRITFSAAHRERDVEDLATLILDRVIKERRI